MPDPGSSMSPAAALLMAVVVLVSAGSVADSRLPRGAPASKRSRAPWKAGRRTWRGAAGRSARRGRGTCARGHAARAGRSGRGTSPGCRIAACQHSRGRVSEPRTPGPGLTETPPGNTHRRLNGGVHQAAYYAGRQRRVRPGLVGTLPPFTVYLGTAKYPVASVVGGLAYDRRTSHGALRRALTRNAGQPTSALPVPCVIVNC